MSSCRLLNPELATPVAVGATNVPINATIGVVEVYRDDQRMADEVLRDADLAMYRAKRERRRQELSPGRSFARWMSIDRPLR